MYVRPSPAVTGAMLTAGQWNQFIVENFAGGVPGQIAAAGDLIVGAGPDQAARLAALAGTYYNRRGLRINPDGQVAWDTPVYWRWSGFNPYEVPANGTPTTLAMNNAGNLGVTPTREGNSYVCVIPETGSYEFIASMLMLIGIGGVSENQVAQLYVSLDSVDYQLARWTVPVTTGSHATNLMNGTLVLPVTAGTEIRFKLRNEMHVRMTGTYGCLGRLR